MTVHIRWMNRRDLPEVLDIENSSFEFPWREEDFIRVLRGRNTIGMVAEYGDTVVGFIIYELLGNQVKLITLAVHPDCRRQGIGVQMIQKLQSKLCLKRRREIVLEVRETNLVAQQFFRFMGFRAVFVLRSWYEDSTEDAYLMRYSIHPSAEQMDMPINRISDLFD